MKLPFDGYQTHSLKTFASNRGVDSQDEKAIAALVMPLIMRELAVDADILAKARNGKPARDKGLMIEQKDGSVIEFVPTKPAASEEGKS